MEYHMEDIIPLRRKIDLKMPPDLSPSPLHSYILSRRNSVQNSLQIRNILHRNINRKCFPVQNITERCHVMILDNYRYTTSIQSFHDSRTRYLVPTWTNTVLAFFHHPVIRNALWKVSVYLNFFFFVSVLVFPVF